MNDLIRANTLLTNEDDVSADDVSEIIEDEEEAGNIGEEDESMDMEADSWQ